MQVYSDPSRENDPHALPDLEVFYKTARSCELERHMDHSLEDPCPYNGEGWYWWSCLPGCLPDSDPVGPFGSAEQALGDARDE